MIACNPFRYSEPTAFMRTYSSFLSIYATMTAVSIESSSVKPNRNTSFFVFISTKTKLLLEEGVPFSPDTKTETSMSK